MSNLLQNFDVIIIEPNKEKIQYGYNREIIDQYISIHKTSLKNNELMNLIVDTIDITTDDIGDTIIVEESEDSVVQLCCKGQITDKPDEVAKQKDDPNYIASYLIRGNRSVYGRAVVLKSRITEDNTCIPDTINIDELHSILATKFIHKGIILKCNKDVKEFTFKVDPLEDYDKDKISNYRWLEVPLFKFNLIIHLQVNPDNDNINKNATRLAGNKIINGDVLITSKSTEHEYIDFDIDTYKKLIKISGGSLDDRNIKDIDKDGEKIDNLPIVMHRYRVLKILTDKFKDICDYCKKDITVGKVCTGCYRARYHDKICQMNHWDDHKNDCLHNKKSINKSLEDKSLEKDNNQNS